MYNLRISEVIMSENKMQKSIFMRQKVRISDVQRRKVSSPKVEQKNAIVHFAKEPIPENELIQNTIEEMAMENMAVVHDNPIETIARQRIAERIAEQNKVQQKATAKQIKEREIEKAFSLAGRDIKKSRKKMKNHPPVEFGFKKIALALACAAVIVAGIVYIVDSSSPNVSKKVVAMQNGINAIYPKYIPRGYGSSPVDIMSENGKIMMSYKNPETGDSFSVVEEASEWTDAELYENYVKDEFGSDYVKVEESGITIYIKNGNTAAAWMDGKVLIKLNVSTGSLTRKQITTIATTK